MRTVADPDHGGPSGARGGTSAAADAYTRRAAEYAAALGSMDAVAAPDRELVTRWALEQDGPIVDLGCGPGHWTAHLAGLGCTIDGVDPSTEFARLAAREHPGVHFWRGTAADLQPGGAAGILAWYSLIHLPPAELPQHLAWIRTALTAGGSLLVGFFEGPELSPFDHAVTTAYRWPVSRMSALLERAGFRVTEVHQRHDDGARPHAAIVCRRGTALNWRLNAGNGPISGGEPTINEKEAGAQPPAPRDAP
ncbi:class I SAM-dependent methyltransferase [Falsarthrobacter nasiphocae]|uniref:SAM-dependent methyltransferase n=1 Tax=Falsarthrobacter nasiphocae TaxID=189863 RepID=A0AAE4C641_9MICC|nr:class I SAM-dependent methyltransferase [Falsarthrobacter nasiphocae]MDR6892163.1 SAM-dependent methyltransferase [Falsarthrobacter nasiphocae]